MAVVYSDSEYGLHCYESLRELAGNDTICFTTPHRVIRYQFQGTDYEQIMRAIDNKPEINGEFKSFLFVKPIASCHIPTL